MRIIEFNTLNQLIDDLTDKLKSDPANITIEENSISYRKFNPDHSLSDSTPNNFNYHNENRFTEMMVWETIEINKSKNRSEKMINLKVKNINNDISILSIKISFIDVFRISFIRYKLLLRKAKRLKIQYICEAFDKKLATINSDRIDEILLGGVVCQSQLEKQNLKPSGNILPPVDK